MIEVVTKKQTGTSNRIRKMSIWLAWLAWSLLLGAVVAVTVHTLIFGRTPFSIVFRGWFSNPLLTVVLLAVVIWWMIYARLVIKAGRDITRSMLVPSLPLLLGTALPLLAIHLSDTVNHYFYYGAVHLNQPKGLTILLILAASAALLQSIWIRMGTMPLGLAARAGIERVCDPIILVLFTAMGVLQATAYMPPPGQDFVRYWLIADAMGQGLPYAANTGTDAAKAAAGMTSFIIDLPLYPAMMVAAFAFLGHTVTAAYVPLVVANIALPPLMFLLVREIVPDRPMAVSIASLVVLFPVLRFYALNWPVPDPIFFAVLAASAFAYVKITRGCTGKPCWIGFGLASAAMVLSRPEGIAYAAIYMLGLVSLPGQRLGKALGAGILAVSAGAFSLTTMSAFGTPWPRNWVGTLGVENILGNFPALVTDEFLTSAVRLSPSQLAFGWGIFLALALVGSLPIVYRKRRNSLLVIPAWINLLSVYLVDPSVSGARLWFDFFRHVSYVVPLFVMASGATIAWGVGLIHRKVPRLLVLTGANVALMLLVLWNTHALIEPSWNFGPNAVNLLSQERPNFIDFVYHPYALPLLGYDLSGTHSEPRLIPEFFSKYPDQLLEFYRPFDAGKLMSGAAYQTGSLLVYIASLLLAVLYTSLGCASGTKSITMNAFSHDREGQE